MRLFRSQELIHWLEVGGGRRLIRLGAAVSGTLVLSLIVAWKQFHGPVTEATLLQADVGHQLALGRGFTTLVNYPQTAAVLAKRGQRFSSSTPYPELSHAPLYSIVIGGALRALPHDWRVALFAKPPAPPDGFGADYFLLGLNVVLFWIAAVLVFLIGNRLFAHPVGWIGAIALLVSIPVWQQVVSVNGTALMMVLALGVFYAWVRADSATTGGGALVASACIGVGCGLLFLTEYSAGALLLVALGYAWVRFAGRARWLNLAILALTFVLVVAPWVMRNVTLTGSPVGLASQNVALKAGDSTAEPNDAYGAYSAVMPAIDLNKLGNKVLTSLQENVRSRVWSGGAMWFLAFFVTGWLYTFRSPTVNRLRWVLAAALGVLLVSQATFNSGESDRWVAVWLSPLLIVFGAGFFVVLVASHPLFSRWPATCACILVAIQGLPLLHDALEPRRIHFQYPPYFPALFQGMRHDLERRHVGDSYGFMADVPAGMAWYSGARVWALPPKLRDFYGVDSEQAIGELLLTPRTLDRPFFSELNARAQLPGTLGPIVNRFGEWGEIYAGLLTGVMPADFPLSRPQRIAENLYVLSNPALPNGR